MSVYIGRFAPSPSGPLHFGSLVTALFSYIHAKQHQGQWFVRIEDLDVPRSVADADKCILDTLRLHGMESDIDVVYQSQRNPLYESALSQLQSQCYFCSCTRADIKAMGGIYDSRCKHLSRPATNTAVRFIHNQPQIQFDDLLHGTIKVTNAHATEDFVIKRKDGLFAYHLAVVCDDIAQNVTHIVRGSDLLDTTCSHLGLYHALSHRPPSYLHLPVISSVAGKKLSKQNHAPAIDNAAATSNLISALTTMGFSTPEKLKTLPVKAIIDWAVKHVNFDNLPQKLEMIVPIA